MDFRGRDPQLGLLVGWLDQLIGQQRLLDKGYEIAHWLLNHVEAPLRAQLILHKDEATLDWFAYSLRRWALTACNHKGVLLEGRSEMECLQSLQLSVATQWERVPLVMEGLIAQAVHHTDCFEFDEACDLMRFVTESLKLQQNLFHDGMPSYFPRQLKFDLRSRALGTLVQSEMFAGATDRARLQSARSASDEAIKEFTSFSERARQYQYRCHLETVGGDFATARKYLIRSLEGTDAEPIDDSHDRIAELVTEKSFDAGWKSEFAILHWLRIGAYACLDAHYLGSAVKTGAGSEREQSTDRLFPPAEINQPAGASDPPASLIERESFLLALDASDQLNSSACQGRPADYPAHSILRFVAVINAACGNWDNSLLALKRLHALDPIGKGQMVLAMVLIAAQVEVAGLLWERNETLARDLMGSEDPTRPGLYQLTQQFISHEASSLITSSQRLETSIKGISGITEGNRRADIAKDLLRIGRLNVY
jgi:hypothetical protein